MATSVNFWPEKELTVKTRPVTSLRQPAEVDRDDLVVAPALAGQVVPECRMAPLEDRQLAEVAAVDVVALRA